MSAGFSYGVEIGMVAANPVRLPKRHEPPRPVPHSCAARFCREHADPFWRAAIVLAGWGILRSGEVAALTRDGIAPDRVEVTIDKAVKRGSEGELVIVPKGSSSYRTVTLPDAVVLIVVAHLDQHAQSGLRGLLYANGARKPIRDSKFRAALHAALDSAGLPRMRFHDIQHIGLTEYGRQGATVADLMRRVGHADPKTVMIYHHSDARHDAELANCMST